MTYDDWKGRSDRDDEPPPEPAFWCDLCKREECDCRPSDELTNEEFAAMMKEIHAHDSNPFAAEEESSQAFIDSARCIRWGSGEDRCILALEHCGPCQDAQGRTTLTLAADILRGRK